MCGIVGFLSYKEYSNNRLENIIKEMSSSVKHRGPDDEGVWIDSKRGIAFGHRRLSIVDLTSSGHQPMHSHSGRYIISFNGEIYNHPEIRQELKSSNTSIIWKGSSDTETLLMAFECWGINSSLEKIRGMFAIAVWDKKEEQLTLIRDRFGEKPLYYGWIDDAFVFASELKAIKKVPNFSNSINSKSLDSYLRLMYVPSPFSIYNEIYKLEPASMITMNNKTKKPTDYNDLKKKLNFKKWWLYSEIIQKNIYNQIRDESVALAKLENCLSESIKLQSRADVQLGAFLSGGLDSSTIVALMQKQNSKSIKTFTIGFEENNFDESVYAKKVAKHLGTDHHDLIVTSNEARDVIPKLPYLYDEPFADSSQIPTYLVSKLAKNNVKVALSGDAGDELFGGYNRYIWGPKVWNKFINSPRLLRFTISYLLTSISSDNWDYLNNFLKSFKLTKSQINNLGEKVHKVARRIKYTNNLDEIIAKPVSEWPEETKLVITNFIDDVYKEEFEIGNIPGSANKMMFCDSQHYLPDDILCKVDRAAMSVSLETRIPFLDHKVAELAWQIPINMKINKGIGKLVLRKLLYKHVPQKLIDRPKMGFAIPVGEWIRGPLRDWAEDLLDNKKLTDQGYINTNLIRKVWHDHKNGKNDWTGRLWAVLMFQSWLENNK